MFPLKDDIPAQVFPVVNVGLIVVNVLCFVYTLGQGPDAEQFLFTYGFVPSRFTGQAGPVFVSAGFVPILSSMFLHGGWLHLVGNMWMLWIFGDNVEDVMGHGRYLVFYLLCGVASVLAQAVSAPASSVPMVGASGAISGVLGAYFLTYPRARVLTLVPIFIFFYLVELPAFLFLGFWFLLQFLQGWSHLLSVGTVAEGGVAWWAHVGGFVTGVGLLRFFRRVRPDRRRKRLKW